MHSSRARFMAPYGLKTLLGGLSRAAFSANPNNIPSFAALYFQELVAFREGNPDLDLTELVEEFRFVIDGWNERLPQSLNAQDASVLGEPKQKEKCTDTEEDQLLRGADTECTSKMTQYPSTHDDVVGNKSPPGADDASSPKGPELAYVPADPAQLATQMLAMAASEAGQPPPHSNVWTLYCLTDLSQGQKSPPSLPPPAAPGLAYSQQQFLQPVPLQAPPPQLSSPTYVMPEESKRGSAPPFILVGSTVQSAPDWSAALPGPVAPAPPDARRFATIPVPVARPAEQAAPKAVPEAARPPTPLYLSVAIPLDDVVAARKGAPGADKAAAGPPFAGSYGIAGQITVTSSSVHQAGS
ncbi:calcium-binding tyrosine phosphorylation-regulated protein [Nothoprocta perdicaria]|uniref:calcium-binding tyrosine phosphorylation-regulated protein n=1 Tax=Nothoprocta perdicaria TaxID=30464 RepID=UPI000E1B9F70|nr:calcium-binding tyrosine phosphorylation-regulated protein [Nothoprocta perdicaria]